MAYVNHRKNRGPFSFFSRMEISFDWEQSKLVCTSKHHQTECKTSSDEEQTNLVCTLSPHNNIRSPSKYHPLQHYLSSDETNIDSHTPCTLLGGCKSCIYQGFHTLKPLNLKCLSKHKGIFPYYYRNKYFVDSIN